MKISADENPDYIFHLDAQTIVLEDYLAVRPEKKELLRGYIAKRRIMVGPWYLQNDFYLTSGEATVRNLLEGQKLCREFGGSAKVGYAADQFGNMSQLPQIMRGFGIDNFIFGRGWAKVKPDENGDPVESKTPTEFIWKGADGSKLLAIHMRHWYNNAQRFSADIDKACKFLKKIENDFDNEFTATPYLLLMNGVDHLEAQPDILQIAEGMQQHLPEGQFVLQYNMDDYVDAVRSYVEENNVQLEEVEGELRRSWDITLLQGTLSSRHYLKVQNCEAQILLENRLEPLYAMMEQQGMRGVYPYDQMIYTWKNLMKNHPHDSICGCSHDGVHAHMENRYQEIFEYGEELLRRGMLTAGEHMAASRKGGEKDYLVTVANTLAVPISGMVKVRLNLLLDDDMEAFTVLDEAGKPVDFRVISKEQTAINVFSPINLPGQLSVWAYQIYLDAGTVNPYSFKTFTVVKADALPAVAKDDLSGQACITNGILSVKVSGDGRVDITDLASGRTLTDCVKIEDSADAGESYMYHPGKEDTPLVFAGAAKAVTLTENNPFAGEIRVDYELPLPAGYDAASGKRVAQTVCTPVTLTLRLQKDESFVRLGYTVTNTAKDHRLRLAFDADVSREESYADIPYDIVHHTAADFYPKTPTKTSPNTAFAALQDGQKGLAIFTVGAHEYEHAQGNRLLFTVVRATGKINGGATENWVVPGNQCLRTISGRMAICPFTCDLISADIVNRSLAFRAPLFAGFSACDSKKFAGGRPCVQDTEITEFFYLPDEYPRVAMADNRPAFGVEGTGVVVTALKKSEDESGLILRLCNYCETPSDVTVTAKGQIYKTMLNEIPRAFIGRDQITLTMGAKEILTLYIR